MALARRFAMSYIFFPFSCPNVEHLKATVEGVPEITYVVFINMKQLEIPYNSRTSVVKIFRGLVSKFQSDCTNPYEPNKPRKRSLKIKSGAKKLEL